MPNEHKGILIPYLHQKGGHLPVPAAEKDESAKQ